MFVVDYENRDVKRLSTSIALAIVFWLVLGFGVSFFPWDTPHEPAKEFNSVSITLVNDSKVPVPVVKEAPKEIVQPIQEVKKNQEAARPSATSTQKASTAQAAKPRASETQKSSSSAGLGIPNFSVPVNNSTTAQKDAEYLDFSSQTQSSSSEIKSSPRGGTPVSEFEGTAGLVQNKDMSASATNTNATKTSTVVSKETETALTRIAGTLLDTSDLSQSGIQSQKGLAQGNSSGTQGDGTSSAISGLTFDGSPRKLIQPSSPSIVLPNNISRLIDSDKTVRVQFTVLADGSVPVGLISFTPSAILAPEVRDFLKREFSSWRFEKKADDGQAQFIYSIKIK